MSRGYTMEKDDYLKRLRRIEGQVRGIQRMVDDDAYCIDVLTQISAATKALESVALALLDEHLTHCVSAAVQQGGDIADQKISEASAAIARLVRSHLFFAHVRAATGTASTRANCHPFVHGRHLFMHNGQIGGDGLIRRRLESLIPDPLYGARVGTTDSEVLFLLALARISEGAQPGEALAGALGDALSLMQEAGIREPLRCAAALADGETIHAVRWSSDEKPPTLYLCDRGDAVVIASEPVDAARECWQALPRNTLVSARIGAVSLHPFEVGLRRAA